MVEYRLLIYVFIVSTVVSYIFTFLMRSIAAKIGIMSIPTDRSVHNKPIPYLGGIAMFVSFFTGIGIFLCFSRHIEGDFLHRFIGLISASTFILLVGLWDDIKNIKPAIKLSSHIFAGLLLYCYGFRIETITNPLFGGEIHLNIFSSVVISLLWFIGIINAINLIDGLDGLAAGIVCIVSISLVPVSLFLGNNINVFLLLALAGSTLGFLRFNFYPAKIFMGDAGSMFVGLAIASVALLGSQYKSATAVVLLIPIGALGIPIYDTCLAVIRRISKKDSIFKADKKHLHHRLLEIGIEQKRIVLFMYIATVFLSIFSFLFVLIPDKYAFILLVLLAIGLFIVIRIIGFLERKMKKGMF